MIVETYANSSYTLDPTVLCRRYWVIQNGLMVGGSVLDAADFHHLQKSYRITDVINVETEHDDTGKVSPDNLFQAQFEDNGAPIDPWKVVGAVAFALKRKLLTPTTVFYVHCQMGGSRSPAIAYAILRTVWGLNPEVSLNIIRSVREDNYGDHAYHKLYLASIERAVTAGRHGNQW